MLLRKRYRIISVDVQCGFARQVPVELLAFMCQCKHDSSIAHLKCTDFCFLDDLTNHGSEAAKYKHFLLDVRDVLSDFFSNYGLKYFHRRPGQFLVRHILT